MITTLDVALSQLGIKEATGKNDGVPAERYMRGDEFAWCAGFILWCNSKSDDPKIAESDKDYYYCRKVSNMEAHLRKKGWFHVGEPQKNDVIFFASRGASDTGAGRHVGIVEFIDQDFVHTVEGNTGNSVAKRSYRLTDTYITGYARIPNLTKED
jgi:hypothetical protein